ncbi:MAG: sulfite reductase subunit alpha [Verrucomicrobia bacterium]|nr:sulfite reductase subunit alpha [Verrucomicrobiota bacterium]
MAEVSTATPSPYNRKNPYLAELIRHERLTKSGSGKDTRHFVLNLAGSGLKYTPGDSLAVFGRNSPRLVDEIIRLTGFDPSSPVTVKDSLGQPKSVPFHQALSENFILNRATKKILAGIEERIQQGEQRNRLMEIVDNDELQADYVYTRDYVDVLKEFDEAKFESPEVFLTQLSPIPPRLYSIASSLAAHPDEVHLCIAIVRYETHGREKTGLCSGFFADHAEMHKRNIPIYVQESRHFRLPKDSARDIIMVGPGTGIAPFRAFLEQRAADGAKGRNWLFFGEQHRASDFFYEAEFDAWQKKGVLTRFDTAFSRDQAQKIYVQNRMLENAKEIWAWLQGGAYFYVCGDAHRMAKDVHHALIDIARDHGGLSPEAAAEYVNVTLMKTDKRYLRDVY